MKSPALSRHKIKSSGEIRGRPNIDNEIGMMVKTPNIGGRIMILKQPEIQIPSNYSEYVWKTFTKKSMDKAFTRVVKELKGFGFNI